MNWASIKLVTFDLDNTLWPVERVIVEAERLLHEHIEETYPRLKANLQDNRLRLVRARLLQQRPAYAHDLSSLRRDSIREFLLEAGVPPDEAWGSSLSAFEVFMKARNQVSFFDGAEQTLRSLGKRAMLGALTNGNADVQQVGLGDVFSFHYSSEKVGKRKPAPDMFLAALEHAKVHPEQALHIGDHPHEDIDAARSLGMHTAWANLLGATWPDTLAAPDFSFSSFEELTLWFES